MAGRILMKFGDQHLWQTNWNYISRLKVKRKMILFLHLHLAVFGLCDDTCPKLKRPVNGKLEGFCEHAVAGQLCAFRCREGYKMHGREQLSCSSELKWNGKKPRCVKNGHCPRLRKPRNGYWNNSCAKAVHGDVCEFHCNDGYRLSGDSELSCLNSSKWDGKVPRCHKEECITSNFVQTLGKRRGRFKFPTDCFVGILMPGVTAECLAHFIIYHYDSEFGQCRCAIYGGCYGSKNMFDTKEDCLQACCPDGNCVKKPDVMSGNDDYYY